MDYGIAEAVLPEICSSLRKEGKCDLSNLNKKAKARFQDNGERRENEKRRKEGSQESEGPKAGGRGDMLHTIP